MNNTQTERQAPIGFLRKKTSKSGMEFLTGMVELNGEKTNIVVFKNNNKNNENSPDYNILPSTPFVPANGAGGQGGQPRAFKPQVKSAPQDPDSQDTDIPF